MLVGMPQNVSGLNVKYLGQFADGFQTQAIAPWRRDR
jgi:hypothetical protein